MKKKHARKLKILAEAVGDIQTQIMTEEPIMGWELLLSGFGKDKHFAKTINPEKQYLLKVPTIIHQSTEKEIKRQFNNNGLQGVAKVVRSELAKRNPSPKPLKN
jgi:hypothetical protein